MDGLRLVIEFGEHWLSWMTTSIDLAQRSTYQPKPGLGIGVNSPACSMFGRLSNCFHSGEPLRISHVVHPSNAYKLTRDSIASTT